MTSPSSFPYFLSITKILALVSSILLRSHAKLFHLPDNEIYCKFFNSIWKCLKEKFTYCLVYYGFCRIKFLIGYHLVPTFHIHQLLGVLRMVFKVLFKMINSCFSAITRIIHMSLSQFMPVLMSLSCIFQHFLPKLVT